MFGLSEAGRKNGVDMIALRINYLAGRPLIFEIVIILYNYYILPPSQDSLFVFVQYYSSS